MRDVFISHVEENSDVATKIADGLEAAGYSTWYYERDSLPGPSYLLQTSRAIEESKAVVLIISPHSLGSYQVTKEVIRAHESGKPFLPILKSISHVEFGNRQPEWREAVGSATSISVPTKGVAAILPRMVEGLKGMGIAPSDGLPTDQDSVGEFRVAPDVAPEKTALARRLGGLALWPKIAIGAVLLLAAAASGTALYKVTRPASAEKQETPPSETISLPTFTQESPSPATELDAATTAIQTSLGPLRVAEALITNEACPPPEIPEECTRTSGESRFLVLSLRTEDGGSITLNTVFTGEAHASVVAFEGRRAGASSVYLYGGIQRIGVVYGVLPASASQGKVLLHWPENSPMKLPIKT